MDDAFARMLSGRRCDAPGDAVGALEALLPPPSFCSRERPWGIHGDLTGRCCPRCGWTPGRRRRAPAP